MSTILPRTQVPNLNLSDTNDNTFDLHQTTSQADNFLIVFFYRGYHCPICKAQLQDLNKNIEKFEELGIKLVAVSSNTEELAKKSAEEWDIDKLQVVYGLDIKTGMNEWGLNATASIKDSEPAQFTEPGMFIIRPNGELYASSIQTMPFTRPSSRELLGGLKYIVEKGYPGRGELALEEIAA